MSRWSVEKVNQWYAKQPWLVGDNFSSNTAINQLEMWHADTFDPKTIDRGLGWDRTRKYTTVIYMDRICHV